MDALFCMFSIIEDGIPYGCSLERFCTLTFQSSNLSLTEGRRELGILVDKTTPTVNGGTKFPISGRVIGADVETVEGAVTPISVETRMGMVAHMVGDTFKFPDEEVPCKDGACEDDCE